MGKSGKPSAPRSSSSSPSDLKGPQTSTLPERYDRSRRRLLQALTTGGVAITVKSLPDSWAKPVLDISILPTHAQTTCGSVTLVCGLSAVSYSGSDAVISPATPIAGTSSGASANIDRLLSQSSLPSCSSSDPGIITEITDAVTFTVSATVNPVCGPVTLTADLTGTNLYSLGSGGGSQNGAVNPNTGVVTFNNVVVGFDPPEDAPAGSVDLDATLDLRVTVDGQPPCIIDINFSERFRCNPPV